MTALEQAIRSMIAEEVAAAEKRIREELGYQDRTLDIQEAATYISSPSKPVSTKTLYGMCERREIPHRRVGSRIFFSTAALDRWGREQDRKNYAEWRGSS
ncbi:helix-turn-helix domain-containing protein [Paenibacillus thiaminolyticus]|uniref:helix-turn-helix domain-containing protein n=1 Tax=Paenibacillus thiaminolyticus TaxID=49283 RepID=UPI001165723A|nr:helix-turn-helix domain-containing protein [Paenibacillus thiaminolyticus]NGP62673.1 helix-turn-helix domain-containing protein [Paenibacillus thiaminolyticus]NGP62726.1 helix-turn-helix domain-containing protein [Paenibacillus thiaminolyticus]WII39668.1 helix-turn-helix domain-containing protein [Paenibacillus thiaminolyticus]